MKLFKIQYYLFVSALLLIYGCKSKPEESNFSNEVHLSYQELAKSGLLGPVRITEKLWRIDKLN